MNPSDPRNVQAVVVSAYEAHHAEVFAFLARATGDRSVAAELLLETYLRLAREAQDGHVPLQVRGWLYRAATDLAMSSPRRSGTARRWRNLHRRKVDERLTAPAPRDGEQAADLERVLEGLSTDARLALLLSGEGFSGHEIADAMGRSAEATRTLLSRARTRVRVRRDLFAGNAR